jgi:uncharacterized glyoxalase superfamily protein PhnB
MTFKKITPVLFAAEIEPCIRFWVERMGFEKTMDVPDGDKLAFAMLHNGSLELMYQTYASTEKDLAGAEIAKLARKGPTFLYVEVDNLEDTIARTKGAPVLMDVRTTFYGAKEISVQDPAGHVITFAQFGAAAA